MPRFLYVAMNLGEVAVVENGQLLDTAERHKVALRPSPTEVCYKPLSRLDESFSGVILELLRGYPGYSHLLFALKVLRRGVRVWLYWPAEEAVECLDRERVASYFRQWMFVVITRKIMSLQERWETRAA